MYLHVGEDILVKSNDIIAILDKQLLNEPQFLNSFLVNKEKDTMNLAKESIKSIVITDRNIYYSPLSSSTLKKRAMQHSILIEE